MASASIKNVKIICSQCGRQMEILEWMAAELDKNYSLLGQLSIPHQNRAHPCVCGKLWLSSDNLEKIGGILVYH